MTCSQCGNEKFISYQVNGDWGGMCIEKTRIMFIRCVIALIAGMKKKLILIVHLESIKREQIERELNNLYTKVQRYEEI